MIFAIIFLLFASLFFSGSETALTSTNRIKLQTKVKNGDNKSEKLLKLVSRPSEFITTILIGNNIANIILPALVTTIAIEHGFSVSAATAALTIVIILVAEIIPKSIAAAFPEKVAYLVYPIINLIIIILKPITLVINKLTDFITYTLSKNEPETVSVSKEELRAIIDIADSEGMLERDESNRIKGVLDFDNLNIKDVLKTPRIEIVAIPYTATFDEVQEVIITNQFSRYPVYDDGIDNIIGVLHAKDLIRWSMNPSQPLIEIIDNEPLIAYEFHSVERVFRQMTKEKKHMAIVLDEYGGTEGIITHEDIIETMIGLEIEDETDLEGSLLIEKLTDTEIICDGKITLHHLNSIFGTDIPEEDDVLAAFLLKTINNIPEENKIIDIDDLTYKILKVNGRTIEQVQIIKRLEELEEE
ncbi:MAG: DUF21 domain-containing protein [Amphibacillus sp.]|nr:DUF21 domain-containing protein [Amphibacillus sp.]